jgi:hypothetical protein
LILIRNDIILHPFYAGGYVWKLDYDPKEILTIQKYSRLYDSGSVTVFYKPVEGVNEAE